MNVGFIGLGHMGVGMAGNIMKAGHAVAVYNRTPNKAEPLVALGATAAPSVADACRGDVVVTMLANDEAVDDVVFGNAGMLASLPKGAIHMSSSTISVALAERLESAHRSAGQRFVAAPVFGRPEAAAAAKLFVVVAGARDAIDAVAPITDAIGQRTFNFGESAPAAHLVKLNGNFLIASVIESLSESMALIAKGGIDPQQYLDLLTSTVFTAPIYKNYGQLIVDRQFEPAGFAATMGFKDVRLALASAETLGVPMPIASLLRDRLLALLATGGGDLDWTAISQLASRDAGAIDG